MNTRQVASRTGLHHDTVAKYARRRMFPGARQRGSNYQWDIPAEAVQKFLARRRAAKKARR